MHWYSLVDRWRGPWFIECKNKLRAEKIGKNNLRIIKVEWKNVSIK